MAKLRVTFRHFSNAPKIYQNFSPIPGSLAKIQTIYYRTDTQSNARFYSIINTPNKLVVNVLIQQKACCISRHI